MCVWVFFFPGEGLCVRCSCVCYLASLHLCHFPFTQSPCCIQSSSPRSPRSPCSQRDTSKVSRSFSSRPESQGGQANQEHSEKVLLNLEEVKVRGRRNMSTVSFHLLVVNRLNLFYAPGCLFMMVFSVSHINQGNA